MSRSFLGLSSTLVWGYVAVAFFMTGDGLEQAFLSDYLVTDQGYTQGQSAALFTVYGLIVAIAAFASGVLAEYFGPRKIMAWGAVGWLVFHTGFMYFGIVEHSYFMLMLMYAIRAAAYPMFAYAFIVWISYAAPQHRLSSAMGWFWCAYSIGVGVFGSYLPSLTIPWIGEVTTLWSSMIFIAVGGVLAFFLVKGEGPAPEGPRTIGGLGRTLGTTFALPFKRPQLALGMVQRIINQISLYAFIVMLPIVFVREVGFEQTTWLKLWALVYIVTVFTNLMWGVLGDRIGWIRTIRWYGSIGMAVATLLLYFTPIIWGPNAWLTAIAVVIFGFALAAYVPISAVMPAMAPEHRGSAVALLNLAAGLSQFVGSLLVTLFWSLLGTTGMVIMLACVYLLGFVLTFFMKVDQDSLAPAENKTGESVTA